MNGSASTIRILLTPPRRFTDPATEAAFLADYRKEGLQFAVSAFILGALAVLIFLLVVAVIGDPLALDSERQSLRLSFALVLLAVSWLFRRRESMVLRFYVPIVMSVVVFSGVVVVSLAIMTSAHELGQDASLGKVSLAMVLVLWLSYGFPRLPIQYVAPALLAPTLFVVAHSWLTSDQGPALSITLYAIVAHAVGIILCMQTERRERAIFAHARDLAKANEKIAAQAKRNQELNEAKSLVLASVSHDLRQPLSSLSLYVNMLGNEAGSGDKDEILRCADHMRTCVGAMEGNLSRILEISRSESHNSLLPTYGVDLASVFSSVETIFAPAAAAAGVELRVMRPAPGAYIVNSNLERLHEVLSNLVSNAIKFSDHRRRSWAYVGAVRTSNGFRIDVRDNGIGIAKEHQGRVFNEYYQVGNPARNSSQGYGLGLSVVKATIGRMRGHSLVMSSKEGKGTRFSILLPRAIGPEQLSAARPALEPTAIEVDKILTGSMVLVVEDDASLREAMSEQLQSWGVVVESAGTYDEALSISSNCERLLDAVLTDFKLPGNMNGIDVIRKVREGQPHRVAAIVTSGEYSFDHKLLDGMEEVRFLPKPIDPETLRNKLAMAISSSLASAEQLG